MKETLDYLKSSLKGKRLGLTALASAVSYSILLFLSFPQYSIQMISYGGMFPLYAIRDLSANILSGSGLLGLNLTLIYAVLSGMLITNLYVSLKVKGLKQIKFAGALGPGALVGACAACGVGLIPLLGIGLSAALMPFNGNLWRITGIAVLLIAIQNIGDPDICEV